MTSARHTPKACIILLAAALAASLLLPSGPARALADPRDRDALSQALNDLLSFAEPGMSTRWFNAETGNGGQVTAFSSRFEDGRACWDYERTFTDAGVEKAVAGTACELEPGLWQIVKEYPERVLQPGPATPEVSPQKPSQATAAASPRQDRALVRETQRLLTELGFDPGPIDGAYGPRTGSAIRSYQRAAGQPVTGEPSQALAASLRQEVANRAGTASPQPASQPASQPAAQPAPQPAPQPQAQPDPESLPWLEPSNQGTGGQSGNDDIAVPPAPPPPPAPQ